VVLFLACERTGRARARYKILKSMPYQGSTRVVDGLNPMMMSGESGTKCHFSCSFVRM